MQAVLNYSEPKFKRETHRLLCRRWLGEGLKGTVVNIQMEGHLKQRVQSL